MYSSLGLEFHRLGYSGKAEIALGKAQAYLKMPDVEASTSTRLQWHLVYAEYLVGIDNLAKSLEYFNAAGELVENDDEIAADKRTGAKIARKVKVNRMISNAAYVSGLLAFERVRLNIPRLLVITEFFVGRYQRSSPSCKALHSSKQPCESHA